MAEVGEPSRGQVRVRVLWTTVLVLAVTWLGIALDTFHVGGGTLVVWLSVAVILVFLPIVSRDKWLIVVGIFVAGLHVIMVFMAGVLVVDGAVLQTRGVEVQAKVTGYTDSWTSVQFSATNKYTRHALTVVTPDGQHGIVGVDGNKPGDTVTVVADPDAAVDLHRPDEVDFVVGLVVSAVDLLMIFGFCTLAARNWRKARHEAFLTKRETSDHEVG